MEWPDACSTEERLFLDLPWAGVRAMIAYAAEYGVESVTAVVNNVLASAKLAAIVDLTLPEERDTPEFRRALGKAAKNEDWFKSISRGERIAEIIGTHLDVIPSTPLAKTVLAMRRWIDE
jgi:putative ATP-dependent endonuclease of OLD family